MKINSSIISLGILVLLPALNLTALFNPQRGGDQQERMEPQHQNYNNQNYNRQNYNNQNYNHNNNGYGNGGYYGAPVVYPYPNSNSQPGMGDDSSELYHSYLKDTGHNY